MVVGNVCHLFLAANEWEKSVNRSSVLGQCVDFIPTLALTPHTHHITTYHSITYHGTSQYPASYSPSRLPQRIHPLRLPSRLLNNGPSRLSPDFQIKREPFRLDIEALYIIIVRRRERGAALVPFRRPVTRPRDPRREQIQTPLGNMHAGTDPAAEAKRTEMLEVRKHVQWRPVRRPGVLEPALGPERVRVRIQGFVAVDRPLIRMQIRAGGDEVCGAVEDVGVVVGRHVRQPAGGDGPPAQDLLDHGADARETRHVAEVRQTGVADDGVEFGLQFAQFVRMQRQDEHEAHHGGGGGAGAGFEEGADDVCAFVFGEAVLGCVGQVRFLPAVGRGVLLHAAFGVVEERAHDIEFFGVQGFQLAFEWR